MTEIDPGAGLKTDPTIYTETEVLATHIDPMMTVVITDRVKTCMIGGDLDMQKRTNDATPMVGVMTAQPTTIILCLRAHPQDLFLLVRHAILQHPLLPLGDATTKKLIVMMRRRTLCPPTMPLSRFLSHPRSP